MVSRKALQCRSEGTKENSQGHCGDKLGVEYRRSRISGGQLGIRDGSTPYTQHGEPVGTQESVDGKMLESSKAL